MDAVHALAAELVTPNAASWPHPYRVMRHPEQRLTRARLLLVEAERLARASSAAGATDVWTLLDDEWAWVGRDPFVRERLLARARELGVEKPLDAVTAMRGAIGSELLPLLHLKWLLATPQGATPHRRYLREWELANDAPDAVLEMYGWYLLTLIDADEEPSPALDANVTRVVKRRGADDPVVRRLLSYYATLRTRLAHKQIQANKTERMPARSLTAVQGIVDAGGGSLAMLELLSLLHLISGVHTPRERLDVAAMHFARALVLDPLNGSARDQLQALEGLPASLRQRASELQKQGQLGAGAHHAIAAVERAVSEAQAYLHSPQAAVIDQHRAGIMLPTLAWRLSLDPGEASQLERLAVLSKAIDDCANMGIAASDYPLMVKARAIQLRTDLADLPWERLMDVLAGAVLPAGFLLPLLLPEPAPPDLATIAGPVRDAALRTETASTIPRRPARWWFDEWLVSRRDWGYKIAAAAGIVMLLYGAGARTVLAVETRIAERAYERVAAAVRAEDDAAAVESALAYLDRRRSASGDARASQVQVWLNEAMMRQVVTLVEGKRVAEAKTLLDQFERVRPPRTDAEPTIDSR
ncbi:MAG TPA: hypothetical protein VFU02_01435 [Polyangiaceae bacterium]|nr:hypothetical protein [Polyangiaceae bacterium]